MQLHLCDQRNTPRRSDHAQALSTGLQRSTPKRSSIAIKSHDAAVIDRVVEVSEKGVRGSIDRAIGLANEQPIELEDDERKRDDVAGSWGVIERKQRTAESGGRKAIGQPLTLERRSASLELALACSLTE